MWRWSAHHEASAIPVKHAHTLPTRRQQTRILMLCTKLPGLVLTASDENTSTGAWALRQRHAYMLHGTTQKAHNILGVHLEPGSVPEPSRPTRIQDTGVAWAVGVLDARINAIQMAMSFYAGGLPAERQPARRSCTHL